MLRRFLRDRRGNYAITTAFASLPLLGAVALAVDYAEATRQKQAMLHALDTTCVATARAFLDGATEAESKAYAQKFFTGNLGPAVQYPTTLVTTVPTAAIPRDSVLCQSTMAFKPFFRPAFLNLLTGSPNSGTLEFTESSTVKVQNTVEVALVLDNSGSMGPPTSTRIDILKPAAKALVDTLAARALLMKKVEKPVQFALVPFAASVNVGKGNAGAAWMDTTGVSPVHYENFDYTVNLGTNKDIKFKNGFVRKVGTGWPLAEQESIFTRFELFKELKRNKNTSGTQTEASAVWEGCVEARPYPYNATDETAVATNPASMFVPMFAPDEHSPAKTSKTSSTTYTSLNNWWIDVEGYTIDTNNDGKADYTDYSKVKAAQRNIKKYFSAAPMGSSSVSGQNVGPNTNCTSTPIMELTDVSTAAGASSVKARIDAMTPLGGTDVPEGMAWGWRTLSSKAPFTGGRSEIENGNDKVVIVLTDGANTYYSPEYLRSGTDYTDNRYDPVGNESDYSAYGYVGQKYNATTLPRLYMGMATGFNTASYLMTNYSTALNKHFSTLCANAKASNIIVMTVALDLNAANAEEKKQIDALTDCASPSKFKKNADGTPKKLFWNSKSSTLTDDFKAIGDELSNLRIIG